MNITPLEQLELDNFHLRKETMAIPDYKTGIKLVFDDFAGEGEIQITNDFYDSSTLMQVDVLGDWIAELESFYNETMEEWKEEMEAVRPKEEKTNEKAEKKQQKDS